MDDLLILRMPDYTALNRPRPDYLKNAYATFLANEQSTLQQLDSYLARRNLQGLRDLVTAPLLLSVTSPRAPPRLLRRHQR